MEDLLNRNPSEQEVDEALNLIGNHDLSGLSPVENEEFLHWVSDGLVSRQSFQNIIDSIGIYRTVVGTWPDRNDIDSALSLYSIFPNFGDDGSGDADLDGFSDQQEIKFGTDPNDISDFPQNGFSIGQYADDLFSSPAYLSRNSPVPPLFGSSRFENYEQNRRDFVTMLYINKYRQTPQLRQVIQGSNRMKVFDPNSAEAQRDAMLQQRQQFAMLSMFGGGFQQQNGGGGQNNQQFNQLLQNVIGNQQQTPQAPVQYSNPEPAILYVVAFAKEETIDNLPILIGMKSNTVEFETVALMSNLWQENLGLVKTEEVEALSRLKSTDRLSAIMRDERYRSRFPSVLRDSVEIAENWKGSSWLGNYFYNEDSYPWVYHSNFGWVYIHSDSDNHAWLFLPKLGWVWVSKDTTEQYSTGITYTAIHEDGRHLMFDFSSDSNEKDIYYDYSARVWRNYSK